MVRDRSADAYVVDISVGRPQPPGWYQDPGRPGLLRYWTGAAWTAQVAPVPAPPPPPPVAVAERRRGPGCLSTVGLAAAALVLAAVVIAIALLRGQGMVTGQRLELQYQAYNGVTGTATLDLVSPGVLQGIFRNPAVGQLPATLTKL